MPPERLSTILVLSLRLGVATVLIRCRHSLHYCVASVRVPLPSVRIDVQVVEVNDSPMRASRWRSSHKGVLVKLVH